MSRDHGKAPFVATHRRRKDGLLAMLLAQRDGEALYRVQWFEGEKRNENTLVRPEAAFLAAFVELRP